MPANSSDLESGSERTNYDESTLISAMRNAIVRQKAAFCCGGTVPITETADVGKEDRFDDVASLTPSPAVVLRWDLPNGTHPPKRIPSLYAL